MKKNNIEDLITKYPKIFRDCDKSVRESCMAFGLEVGPGWYNLIDQLCKQLQWDTDKNDYPQTIATQVKEKWGMLCFYYTTEQEIKLDEKVSSGDYKQGVIEGAINFAEHMSGYICEVCGTPGKINTYNGWYATTCKKCDKKRRKKSLNIYNFIRKIFGFKYFKSFIKMSF